MSRAAWKLLFLVPLLAPPALQAARRMENLNRGVVAVRKSSDQVFISWRVLGLDDPDTGFNLYRSTDGGTALKLNPVPLMVTNFTDTKASGASEHAYFVRPVVKESEQAPSISFTLAAGGRAEPAVRIPIRFLPDHATHFVWVGDLDGDGEYDFVFDRLPTRAEESQKLEAYTRGGEFLWRIDLGPGSLNRDRYEPGPSAISTGHWDGVTVYDLDGDGRAEVALRSADGVVFGDGRTLSGLGEGVQAMSIIDGFSGAERARAELPRDFMADGPLAAHMGAACLDGFRPSLVAKLKNRVGKGGFNLMIVTWDFAADDTLRQRWKWLRGSNDGPDFHQIRVFDVNQDGRDEICDGGYVINADGTFRYKVGGPSAGVVHGDRFHIGDFDPRRRGLEGFAVQQNHPAGLHYLVYDAATGSPIHLHKASKADVGRGVVADIDPAAPGCEYWAFDGVHRIDTKAVLSRKHPWPNFRIWWDGDLLAETLNRGIIEKWNPSRESGDRLFSLGSGRHAVGGSSSVRDAPYFYGDILGDWREEIISFNHERTELIICTTDHPTQLRIPTLAHNPAYRAAMTTKGYLQCHHPDYFLGPGMVRPPRPDILYQALILHPGRHGTLGGGAVIENRQPGFRGKGYAAFAGAGHLEWTRVNGAGGGRRKLVIRYANGDDVPRRALLGVNGKPIEIEFPSSGGWASWATLDVSADFKPAATNTLRIEPQGAAPLPSIDCIALP